MSSRPERNPARKYRPLDEVVVGRYLQAAEGGPWRQRPLPILYAFFAYELRTVEMFDRQPILSGQLLQLRPLVAADYDDLYRVAADPLIWAQHPDPSRAQPAGFKVFFDKALESGGALVALDSTAQQIIGTSRYHRVTSNDVMVGYTFLARAYWGGRYNGEMKRLMLDHAFRFVPAVTFRIGENNLRSRRAVEKLGAIFEGVEPQPEWGQIHVIYRLSRTSWQERSDTNVH